eukprot:RCo024047
MAWLRSSEFVGLLILALFLEIANGQSRRMPAGVSPFDTVGRFDVAPLSVKQLKTHVLNIGRPFPVVVLVTVEDRSCEICYHADRALLQLSRHYHRGGATGGSGPEASVRLSRLIVSKPSAAEFMHVRFGLEGFPELLLFLPHSDEPLRYSSGKSEAEQAPSGVI